MKVLLTRPKSDSDELAKKLERMGFKTYKNPLIKIKKIKISKNLYPNSYDLIIFTSKNGIKFFQNEIFKSKKTLTIGQGTFKEAKKKGYKNILCADGSIKELKELFAQNFRNTKSSVLHPTSIEIRQDLKNFIERNGCNYINLPVYETEKHNFSPDLFKSFILSGSGLITLLSQKTAESFVDNISQMNLNNYCSDKTLVVFSEAIKLKLEKLSFKKIIILGKPNEENLLYTIRKLLTKNEDIL